MMWLRGGGVGGKGKLQTQELVVPRVWQIQIGSSLVLGPGLTAYTC